MTSRRKAAPFIASSSTGLGRWQRADRPTSGRQGSCRREAIRGTSSTGFGFGPVDSGSAGWLLRHPCREVQHIGADAAGDTILDFKGNGPAAGNSIEFTGFSHSAYLTHAGDTWTIHDGSYLESFTMKGVSALCADDFHFI